jgi:hypothetical protein
MYKLLILIPLLFMGCSKDKMQVIADDLNKTVSETASKSPEEIQAELKVQYEKGKAYSKLKSEELLIQIKKMKDSNQTKLDGNTSSL